LLRLKKKIYNVSNAKRGLIIESYNKFNEMSASRNKGELGMKLNQQYLSIFLFGNISGLLAFVLGIIMIDMAQNDGMFLIGITVTGLSMIFFAIGFSSYHKSFNYVLQSNQTEKTQ